MTRLSSSRPVPLLPIWARPETKGVETYTTDNSVSAPATDWPSDEWWTPYGDEQLSGLMTEALAGKPRRHSCYG